MLVWVEIRSKCCGREAHCGTSAHCSAISVTFAPAFILSTIYNLPQLYLFVTKSELTPVTSELTKHITILGSRKVIQISLQLKNNLYHYYALVYKIKKEVCLTPRLWWMSYVVQTSKNSCHRIRLPILLCFIICISNH